MPLPTPRLALCLAFLMSSLHASEPTPLRLWSGAAPMEKGGLPPESDLSKPNERPVAGRAVIRLGNVADPTLAVYRPQAGKETGTAVLVCPGGGYNILAWDLEGTEVCEWFNSFGVTAVLLKYRVPRREGRAPYAAPLEDVQRAMGIVRTHAKEWGIDPGRIGTLGFSAGGNLCAILAAGNGTRAYPRVDAQDDVSCLPNFQFLIYPAYLVGEHSTKTTLEPESAPTAQTPPTFMVMADDDPIRPENVLAYSLALKALKVPFEAHVFLQGGHGYGLRKTALPVTGWPALAEAWMRASNLLGPR